MARFLVTPMASGYLLPMDFATHVRRQLTDLTDRGLLRSPRFVAGPQDAYVHIAGRRVLCLCSNNYLGLANHPVLQDAARDAILRAGYGSGASRHISGSEETHLAAQERLSAFLRQPAGLLFGSGYAANVGAIQALVSRHDIVFSDALNHASLIDGIRLSRAPVFVYAHRDMDQLRELLVRHRHEGRACLVVSDSVFSMDGDLADLQALRALCDEHDAGLLVDEAHALGVLGPQGAGLCAARNVRPDLLVAPLGKAFGTMGALVAGSPDTVQLIENRARSYVFSTAPPPSQAAAVLTATDLVSAADDRRQTIMTHAAALARGLRDLGIPVPEPQSAILPVHVGPPGAAMALSAALFERGVFVHGIRPPTVPPGTSRLRVTTIAAHTPDDIELALAAFAKVRPHLSDLDRPSAAKGDRQRAR